MKRTRTLRTYSLFQKIVAYLLSAAIPLATLPGEALALPHGGVVSKGSATLGYSTGKLSIRQSTSSATFDWSSYNVKAGQSVVYSVPGSRSVSLNYIGGTTPSSIDGKVSSNGILEFMNPNGLIFGSGSVVSAAGVMAFGSATPWGKPTGPVSNAGVLTATDNGTVALVGTSVANSGTITAPGGEVLLAAGTTVTPLATTGVSSLSVATTGGGLVDDSGIVSAETVDGKTGTILLESGMGSGTTTLASTAVLDASAPNGGNGGVVLVNGSGVVMDNTTPINVSAPYGTAGTVKIDPNYIQSGSTLDICNTSGLEYLDTNQTSYLSDTINLEENMNLGGYSWTPLGNVSTPFTGTFNGNGHTVSGYTITATENMTGFIGALGSTGKVENLGVTGTVDGGTNCEVGGLVGYNNGGTISYSYATGNVSGTGSVGGLVGCNNGTISYSYATGNVSGSSGVGGLVGTNSGTISYSYATGNVSGSSGVGGLVGTNSGTISYSYATGNVIGQNNAINVGGLVGYNNGTISYSYATGTVIGQNNAIDVGGLVGYNNGTISYSYATGAVSGTNSVGGLVGDNNGTIQYSYATGAVSGTNCVGGLVGGNLNRTYTEDYWNTTTSGTTNGVQGGNLSGVTGLASGTFGNSGSFTGWSFNTWSGGKFISSATASPWFMGSVVSGTGTMSAPMLVPDLATATVTGNSGTSVYNGSTVTAGYTTTTTMGGTTLSPNVTVTTAVGPNAGTYANTPTYTISSPTTQTSVDSVSAVSGTWKITPATLTATANDASMTYGSSVPALSGTVTGFVNGQTLTADSGTANWTTSATSSSNIGQYGITGKVILGASYSGDYTIVQAYGNSSALMITPATLIATANTASMTYGGTVPTLSGTVTGFVNGQTLSGDGGTASWTTSATSASKAGIYGITGSVSMTLGNPYFEDYTIVQAPGNSSALTITATGGGSSGSGTPEGITSDNFNPVIQTVNLYQKLPALPGISSAGTSSDNPSSPFPSGKSMTLDASQNSSLMVIQPGGEDTSPDGILSVEELKN
ncbi:MAG: GLUG motif-containing protein [Leptospirillum sp.]